ncbi:hypothetical protein HO133_004373 [Letharia lupina]|uniref:Ubiquitin-like domain-containing protein n=1 Tax=Letharia lupina TaxID=560253 RepID=A0A8H6FK65_9LECA|nr:uncharacterized protein HO133_004373 [Letharia lupina]KAF6230035.1 hypothetical protein HO133_004373 [Letharia lupina]
MSDLFAALKIVKDSFEAVNEKKGAAADYANLVSEIDSLWDGLEAVEDIQSDPDLSEKQIAAIKRAVDACYDCVESFLESVSDYQPHLGSNSSGFASNYRKIKWALCKKDDVAKFRGRLGRHISSINMLLITFQAKQSLNAKTSRSNTVVKALQSEENSTKGMMKGLSIEQRQFFMIMVQQNKQLMQSIEDMRNMLQLQAEVPPQVMLQQPVIFLDPFGKTAPFHLEFVDSSECFMAVLKARFSNAGVTPAGLSKLDNHDFLIQDSPRRRPIDLKKNWASVFRPGQNVDMSMIFHRFACPPSTCPVCLETNEDDHEQVHCRACGLCYQNVQAISRRSREWDPNLPTEVSVSGDDIPYLQRRRGREPEMKVFRPTQEAEDELFDGYRRVQLVSQSLDLLDGKFPALQLIEDFARFAELLKGVPDDTSAFEPEIRNLRARAVQHLLQQRSSFPAFASFSQIAQVRRRLGQESLDLRKDIDKLVYNLYNDSDTKELMKYVQKTYPSDNGKDYYTSVLSRIASLSDFTKSSKPSVRSTERMEWLLLDGRSK